MSESGIFDMAINMPPQERSAFLAKECGDNASLRAAVESLLRAHDTIGDFIGASPIQFVETNEPLTGEQAGAVIGPYRLVEPIGEGGMGSVWRAEQTTPIKRDVAIKFIRSGLGSKMILARFDAERQALAIMDHPNIATVLDAGINSTTDAPFFVMELVKGTPITKFCDSHRLSLQQRLELFIPVCQAIQHAHQKGVIHRDIKPSNVLVTTYGGRPVPKVIDFGLAKATGESHNDVTMLTGAGAIVGTPEYMSPEQARLDGIDIDTRSDVYALGVLLYELITGTTPVDKKTLGHAALIEVLRIVCEDEPQLPSAKLSSSDALPSIAANRATEPSKLSRMLKGDLDWVVMKALEKDRNRRYDTANGLIRDIERYLADEVVEARAPSATYRLQKFVRRNRGSVFAASLIVLALIAGIVGTSMGLIRADAALKREAERAEGERQAKLQAQANAKLADERRMQVEAEKTKTEAEKKVAVAVTEFLCDRLLGQANLQRQASTLVLEERSSASRAKLNPTIRELLDRASDQLSEDSIEKNFPGQPLAQAALLMTLGVTYESLGEFRVAAEFLSRAVALRSKHLGANDPVTLSTLHNLAHVYGALGNVAKEIELYKKIHASQVAQLGADHQHTLITLSNLGSAYANSKQYPLAIEALDKARQGFTAKSGQFNSDTLIATSGLALVYMQVGRLSEAIEMFERVRTARAFKFGPDHPATIQVMHNLASAYRDVGRYPDAIAMFKQIQVARAAKLGTDHPDTLNTDNGLAGTYFLEGQLKEAIALWEKNLAVYVTKYGDDFPRTVATKINLANAYLDSNQLDRANMLISGTHDALRKKHGETAVDTLSALSLLARVERAEGHLPQAVVMMEKVHHSRLAQFGPTHPLTLLSLDLLSGMYADIGRKAEAETLVKLLIVNVRQELPAGSSKLAGYLRGAGTTLLNLNLTADAESLLRESLAISEKQEPDSWKTFENQSKLGQCLFVQKKLSEAEPLLLGGLKGMLQRAPTIVPLNRPRLVTAADRLIAFYNALHKPAEAKKWEAERAKIAH